MHEKIILNVHLQVGEHIPSSFSMSTVLSFKNIKNMIVTKLKTV